MSIPVINGGPIPILERVLQFTEKRHTLLAGNVANMDTPGYRARDLSVENFQNQLKHITQKTHTRYVPGYGTATGDQAQQDVRDPMKTILRHDENDIRLENEVTEISKNAFMHNLAVSIMRSQFAMLETAITERV